MRISSRPSTTAVIVLAVLRAVVAGQAHGAVDLTASYDGRLTVERTQEAVEVAAQLSEAATTLSGSVAFGPMAAGESMLFAVQGSIRGLRVKLLGASANGMRLVWIGKLRAGGLRGRALLRSAAAKVRGRMDLERRSSDPGGGGGGPAACENAYFADEVMPKVLVPICAQCHGAGGQAAATTFRVTPGDPLATQASVALHVDVADPAASRILRKPLALLPHGGGRRIVAGSAEADILRHWVDLVAQGVCGGTPGGGGGTPEQGLYADNCASCHDTDARGVQGRPDIRCAVKIHDPVRFGLGTGADAMPSFDALTDADIVTLQDHLKGLCDASGREGLDLYTSNCARCHGGDARGIDDRPNVRCAVDVTDAVRTGRGAGAMPAYPPSELSALDVGNVQDHLTALCAASGPSRPADLYLSNCASCHGPTGSGARSSSGVHGPKIQCQSAGDIAEKVRFGEDEMPAYPTLSSADIAAITTYLHGYCVGGPGD